MPVPLDKPVVTPAIKAKEYSFKFFTDFAVSAKSGTEGDIFIRSVPLSEDGELLQSQPTETRCQLWEAAAEIKEAAAAMEAVMKALPLIEAWATKEPKEKKAK